MGRLELLAARVARAAATPATTLGRVGRPWNIVLPVAFALGTANSALYLILEPRLIGSHGWIYTDATRAWLSGGDPWRTGPPAGNFAGPPPMLLPFLPFVGLPNEVIAAIWFVGALLAQLWLMRRLGLPGYWLGFNPFVAVVATGHLEVFGIALLFFGGSLGGLAAIVKPYMGFALLAQQRWKAIGVAVLAVLVTAPFLPWERFISERAVVAESITHQYFGDSVFGDPVLMVVAIVALASLGWRRALWIGAPVLWPYAQQGYKLMALPLLSPVMALFWAIPLPGATLAGVVVQAVLERVDARQALPGWLRQGIRPLTQIGLEMSPHRVQASRTPATLGGTLPEAT